MNDILYVILNGSLNMSSGKAAAQAVHAAMMLNNTSRSNFRANYRRSVIVLEAKNREQMDGICDYLSEAEIDYEYYVDEGKNEVDAFSFTALVVEPFDSDDERKREIFADLPLYGDGTTECNYDDDYNPNGCSPEPDYRDVECARLRDALITSNQEVSRLRAIVNKPKWYKRIFKRKQVSYVS